MQGLAAKPPKDYSQMRSFWCCAINNSALEGRKIYRTLSAGIWPVIYQRPRHRLWPSGGFAAAELPCLRKTDSEARYRHSRGGGPGI